MHPVHRLAELLECRYALVAEFHADHALGALDAIRLGAPQVEVGDYRTVSDEFAVHCGGLPVVHDLGGGAAAEVLLPRSAGQRVEIIVDEVGAHRKCEPPSRLSPGEAQHHQLLARGSGERGAQQGTQQRVDDTE